MRLNKYVIWVIITTIFGIFFQTLESIETGKPFEFMAVIIVWFFIFGVVPSGVVHYIKNRKGGGAKGKPGALGRIFNRKVVIIIVVVLIILFIALNYLTYYSVGLLFWEMAATESLPMEEVQAKAGAFTRNYPDVIKGNWEPNAWHMERMLMFDADRLKQMGVNTLSISVNYEFSSDGTLFIRDEGKTLSNLVRAKEAGFAVYMTPSFGRDKLYDFEGEGIRMTKEDFLRLSEEVTLEWAEFAEKYAVEYISPVNELDGIIHVNYAGDLPWGERIPEMTVVVGEWHKQLLPKMRNVFTGKIMAKLGASEREFAQRWGDFAGYDIIGTGSGHDNLGLAEVRGWFADAFNTSATIAERNGVPWAVLEAWYPVGGIWWPVAVNKDGESLDELHDDYFRISTEEYLKRGGGVGYVFHSWTMPISPVKDRPAEQVLTDFFSKI